jgi:hypothetical protein
VDIIMSKELEKIVEEAANIEIRLRIDPSYDHARAVSQLANLVHRMAKAALKAQLPQPDLVP